MKKFIYLCGMMLLSLNMMAQIDLNDKNWAVKKTISISSTIDDIKINDTDKVTFRVTDSFEITGPFQVNNGAEFAVIVQNCP